MIKSQLINQIAVRFPDQKPKLVEQAIRCLLERLETGLATQGRVEIRGFGSFYVQKRESRIGRNPKTGALVSMPEKYVPQFKAGKRLRERVNQVALS